MRAKVLKIKYDMSGDWCDTKCSIENSWYKVGSYACIHECPNFLSHNREKQIITCRGKKL